IQQHGHGSRGDVRLALVSELGSGDEHGGVEERGPERLVDGLISVRSVHGPQCASHGAAADPKRTLSSPSIGPRRSAPRHPGTRDVERLRRLFAAGDDSGHIPLHFWWIESPPWSPAQRVWERSFAKRAREMPMAATAPAIAASRDSPSANTSPGTSIWPL